MSINWLEAFNKLMKLLDEEPTYHSGGDFIKVIKDFSDELPQSYNDAIEFLKRMGLSTTRRDYFKYFLEQLPEHVRVQAYAAFAENLRQIVADKNEDSDEEDRIKTTKYDAFYGYVQNMISGGILVPKPVVEDETWNAERIKKYLEKMDRAFNAGEYEQTNTLAYTFLEGLFKAFLNEKDPGFKDNQLIAMGKRVRDIIEEEVSAEYPTGLTKLIATVANNISEIRNRYSDSHFDRTAERSIAQFSRDLVNSVGRYVLSFLT
ncbi:hypothetical protein [Cohnella soli]|uniref:Abortive infection protein-like C-terminal domain-containing protein n=1 Tax=Cohnella soli TaxID=425005 RepID=A0ABW0HPB3_9BACL